MARASDSSRSAVRRRRSAPRLRCDDPRDERRCRCACRSRPASARCVATIVKSEGVKAEGLGPARVPIWNREGDVPSAELSISSLLIGGPYNGRVPQDSPSRRRIFVCQPGEQAGRRDGVRDEDSVDAGAACVSAAGDDRRRPDAARLLSDAPAPTATSTPAFARRSSGCSSALISCSGSKPIPTTSRRARRIVSPTSSSRRACRSSCGAASRTTNCSTWRFAGSCGTPASSSGRCGACSPIRARARRWWTTSSASGCRRATSGC